MARITNAVDKVHHNLSRGVEWSGKNARWVVASIVVFIILGSAFSLYGYYDQNKETKLQEGYYKTERAYSEKKRELAAKGPATLKAADLEKNLGTLPADFETVLSKNPSSQAGRMAALNLVEIYSEYGMPEKALAVYDRVGKIQPNDLTQGLLIFQKANVLSNVDKCADAVKYWDDLIKADKVAFFKREAQLRKALCLEKTGDVANAEQIYTELAQLKRADGKESQAGAQDLQDDSQVATEAQKYLRLLKMKKGT
ncbi:MAG: tetratricopeptide repeat protein [Bdellovibrionota bacterium]